MDTRETSLLTILPKGGYIRLSELVGDPKADPPIPAIIPVAKSTIWLWLKQGRFPKPCKFGPRVTAWSCASIRAFLEESEKGK